ncbi:MAG: hypothetical protein H0U67_04755 [Gemmatimonadetes bacterium]|nr:hypothetical protein [Gemmatimonadota bacterium]
MKQPFHLVVAVHVGGQTRLVHHRYATYAEALRVADGLPWPWLALPAPRRGPAGVSRPSDPEN